MAIDSKAAICNMALMRAQLGRRIEDFDTDSSTEGQALRDVYDNCRDEVLSRYRWPWAEAQRQLTKLGGAAWSGATTYAVGDAVTYGSAGADSAAVGVPNLGGPLDPGVSNWGARVYRSLQAANTNHQPDTSGTFWRRISRDGWGFVYVMPADCLMPREIYSGARVPRDFETFPHAMVYDPDLGKLLLCVDDTPDLRYTARVDNPVIYPPGFVSALAWRLAAEMAGGPKADARLAAGILAPGGPYEMAMAVAYAESGSMEQGGMMPESIFISARG